MPVKRHGSVDSSMLSAAATYLFFSAGSRWSLYIVLMSFASARCQPFSVKRLMWAAMSVVTAMPFRGHPLACSSVSFSPMTQS